MIDEAFSTLVLSDDCVAELDTSDFRACGGRFADPALKSLLGIIYAYGFVANCRTHCMQLFSELHQTGSKTALGPRCMHPKSASAQATMNITI